MPHCYFVNDYRQSEVAVIDSKPPDRADHGLPPLLPTRAPAPALAGDDKNDDGGAGGADRWTNPRARDWGEAATPAAPAGQTRVGGRAAAGREGALAGTGTGTGVGVGAGGCTGSPVVLCNFNRLHKIDPHTFGAWMEVRRKKQGSSRGKGFMFSSFSSELRLDSAPACF